MKILFDAVVFLRTDKDDSSTGHPVDRIELNDFVEINLDNTPASFIEFSNECKFHVSRFLATAFSTHPATVIYGLTAATKDSTSEFHAIRSSDIRNIVVLNFEEKLFATFNEYVDIV